MSSSSSFWSSLSSRERKVIGWGLVIFLMIVLYSLVWAPMHDRIVRLRAQVQSQIQDLAWMNERVALVTALSKGDRHANHASSQPLLTVIDQTTRTMKIRDRVKQMQPGKEAGTAKVSFDKVVFEDWLAWLDNVSRKGIGIRRVSITRSSEEPKVNIRLELYRPGELVVGAVALSSGSG